MPNQALSELYGEVTRDLPATSNVVAYVAFPLGFYPRKDNVEAFRRIIDSGQVFRRFAPLTAPAVVGMRSQKQALLLSLASLLDWGDCRNRLHTLYWGPTGTAKAQLAATVMRLGGGWSSVRPSQVGLTASGSGKEVEYGLLPLHNKGVVGVDELDKLSREDQAGCLSAMEEGLVPINVGKHHEILEAEVVVIATANDPARLAPELIGPLRLRPGDAEPNVQESRQIIEARIRSWGCSRESGIRDLGRFLTWIRSFEPDLGGEVRTQAIVEAQHLALEVQRRGKVRIRRLETLVRVALAHARLHHRDVASEDVEAAARFVVALNQRP